MRAALCPVLDPMLARSHAGGAAFVSGDDAIVIGVQTRKSLFGLGPRLGDDDGAALTLGTATHLDAGMTGSGTGARTRFGATRATSRSARFELGAADLAILVGVEPVEHGGRALGASRLHPGAHFLGRDHAVLVGVQRGQPIDATADELSLSNRRRPGSGLTRSARLRPRFRLSR